MSGEAGGGEKRSADGIGGAAVIGGVATGAQTVAPSSIDNAGEARILP